MTCLHFHSNTETWSDVYTHTVICTQRWTRAHIHTVNLVTNSQVHSLTVMYMHMINIHTYTYTHAMTQKQMYTLRIWHKWTWLYIHSQVNMLPAWTCLQIHSYVWTQKNTLTHWHMNRLNSLLHKEMLTYFHRLHIHSYEHAHRFISIHRHSVVPWCCSGKRTYLPVKKMQETLVWSLGQEDSLEKEMGTHSSTLTWKIPWIRGAW